jgi:2-dehydropantoate 2-reductase
MKFAMMGSGGVGGYFGGRLAAAGHDVTFIARGAHLAAIRNNGLRIESGLGEVTVQPARASDDGATVGQVDYVIIAVKLWDTEAAGRAVVPMLGAGTSVVSLQNGVEADDILAAIVGRERLIGGAAFIAASIARPGVIAHLGTMQRVVIGEPDGGASPRVEGLLSALAGAGVDAEISDDIARTLWEKFVFLVGLSATTTLMRTTVGPVREDPDSRAFLLNAMREVVAVGRAKGIDLAADYADDRLAFADRLPPDMTSSMRHDLDRGNRLEVGWLSGAVVRFGAALGIPVPLNHTVYAALKPLAAGNNR